MLENTLKNKILWIAICLHIPLLFLPGINLEFAFSDAISFFSENNTRSLDQFFYYQANTLAMPYSGYLINLLLPFLDPTASIRLLSIGGLLLFAISVRRICDFYAFKANAFFWAAILFNPLVWTYSARATADFFPAALCLFAFSFLCNRELKKRSIIIGAILFGIAGVFKYHSLLLLPILFIILWERFGVMEAIKKCFIITGIAVSIVALYVALLYDATGVLLTPQRYQSIHSLSFDNILSNFFLYIGYLVLLCSPVLFCTDAVLNVFKDKKKMASLILAAILFFLIGYSVASSNGELNFGPFDRFLSHKVGLGLLMVMGLGGFYIFYQQINAAENKRQLALLALGVLVFVLILSTTRPAQRYLLYIAPFVFLFMGERVFNKKILLSLSIGTLIVINSFIAISQYGTGAASLQMVEHLKRNNLIQKTHPGSIEGHQGNEFPFDDKSEKKYTIIEGNRDNSVHTATSPNIIGKKIYSLIPLKGDDTSDGKESK